MSTPPDNLIDGLRSRLDSLPRQEAAVARAILANPSRTPHVTIAELARSARVSQPTVLRLCRAMGYDGFPDLKVALAQSLVPSAAYVAANVEPEDSAAAYVPKIFSAAITALNSTRMSIDTAAVDAAVVRLADARAIVAFGVGGSASIVEDFAHKFARLSIPCRASADQVLTTMLIESAEPGDVLFVVSNTGRTRAVVAALEAARARGLAAIALTAPDSPAAAAARYVVPVEPVEDAEVLTPMASRIVQLALVDALATGVALRLGKRSFERLVKIKRALAQTRFQRSTNESSSDK